MPIPVTVVVPTKDSIRTVEACLASIRAQHDVDVELVVVDNHSTDATVDVAHRWADLVLLGGPERSAQRNIGIRAGTGAWICWIDSDMILPPDTLRIALDVAAETGARTVTIPERTIGSGYWTACRALERRCYLDDHGLHNPRLLRLDLWRQLGGFDETMSGPEDADLRLRLLAMDEPVAYASSVLIDHDEGRLTLRGVWAKRVYYGRSLPSFVDAHPRAVADQGRELVRTYWRNRRILLADPAHFVGVAFLRISEAFAYLWGYRRGRAEPAGRR